MMCLVACEQKNNEPEVIEPVEIEAVNLGLSVAWANMNVGAINPVDFGDYFAWGETEPKDNYVESTYGYNSNVKKLPLSNGAAYAKWGGTWRMPTDGEWDELKTKCRWYWVQKKGVTGYEVWGNGHSIFLPAAGMNWTAVQYVGTGCYWSSVISPRDDSWACNFQFSAQSMGYDLSPRYYGMTIRPVCKY